MFVVFASKITAVKLFLRCCGSNLDPDSLFNNDKYLYIGYIAIS